MDRESSVSVFVRLTFISTVTVAFVWLISISGFAAGLWAGETSLPVAVQEVSVTVLGQKVYVVGGSTNQTRVNTVYAFDPAVGAWSTRAPYPGTARDHIGIAAIGSQLYLAGGVSAWPGPSVATVQRYDEASNTWTAVKSLPVARGAMAVAVLNGKIYAAGGLVEGSSVTDFTVYDPVADAWQTLPPMPTPRDHAVGVALDGKFYVTGGRTNDTCSPLATVEVFDPASGSWSTAPPMQTPRGGHGAGVVGGKLYVFGGEGAPSTCGMIASTEQYDPATGMWTSEPDMLTPRHGTGGAVIGTTIYVPGGGTAAGDAPTDVVEKFLTGDAGPLPAPWTSTDIGAVGQPGSASAAGGVFTVKGAGVDIWGSSDSFHFVYQPLTGDGEIVARVASLQNTNEYAKAGVMLRGSLGANAPHVILDVKPGGGVEFMTRSAAGGATTFLAGAAQGAPVWLRLARSGALVIASWSSNGLSWSEVGRTTTTLPSTVYAGLPVLSHNTSTLMTATFDNVSVTTGAVNPPPSVTITAPPSGASFTAPASVGVTATASDSNGTVTSVQFFANGTSLGVDTTSPFGVTWNATTPGPYTLTALATDSGGAQTQSPDVTVTITDPNAQLPSPWASVDVGLTGVTGSATHSNGVFTVKGAGADIWDSTDSFHFVYQPLAGDGEIVARVASLQNTHQYAKAGLMLRASLAANAAHVILDVKPGGGVELMTRSAAGGTTTFLAGTGQGAPVWLRLSRSGALVIASWSSNGLSWSEVGRTTTTLPSTVYAGLPVLSHNTSALMTATFDNVSVTTGAVNPPPSVTITAPASGASFTAPATVGVTATASDSNGTVTSVQFFANGTSLGVDTTSPFGVTWNATTPGPYTLTALATDSGGAQAQSPGVTVTITDPASPLPAPWASVDIGAVGAAGSATHSNGVFTVKGAGADIWGSSDSFHFVYQPLTGDGQITARVTGMQNTHQFAKAGVMFRQALTSGSPHVMLNLLPDASMEFLSRSTAGDSTTFHTGQASQFPGWIKMIRTGNSFTAFASPDGVVWTEVGSASVPLAATVYVGLPVSSHVTGVLNTATFDNVSVSTDTTAPSSTISFTRRALAVGGPSAGAALGIQGFQTPTSLQLGPGGRLYVATALGKLYILTLDAAALDETDQVAVTNVQQIDAIYLKPSRTCNIGGVPSNCEYQSTTGSGRLTLGLLIDPASTANNIILYVSHSSFSPLLTDMSIDTYSGTITRLRLQPDTGTASPDDYKVVENTDLVVGLPRSREVHAVNGMSIGPDGWLYLAVGGHTNAGKPSEFFANLPEYYLSASVVRLNLSQLAGRTLPIDVSGVETAAHMTPLANVFELYATGYRNPYDLTWHSNGKLYLNDNAANDGQGNTPGATEGCSTPSITPGNRPDDLNLVTQGVYGGHPNPARGECVFDDGTIYSPDLTPAPHFLAPLLAYLNGSSTNGIVEYTSDAFGGLMKGNLVSATFAGNQNVRRVALNAAGTGVLQEQNLGTFIEPLDVTTDSAGRIFVAEYGASRIAVMIPTQLGTCPVPDSNPGATDSDGDGYMDADETANGTDVCSPASVPADFDGDHVSDLNDPDDDADGIADGQDQLFFDAFNGTSTPLPLAFEYNPSSPAGGGVVNTGFTGVQIPSSGVRLDASEIKAGDAGGHLTLGTHAGTAAGSANSQVNALQVGFDSTSAFRIWTRVVQPFATATPAQGHVGGIFFGPNQDNYFRLAVLGTSGGGMAVQAALETAAVFSVKGTVSLTPPISSLDLVLVGDAAAKTLTAYVDVNGSGTLVPVAVNVPAPAAWFSSNGGSSPNTSLAGMMTSHGAATPTAFGFDFFRIDRTIPPPPTNDPPAVPSGPLPPNGAADVLTTIALNWAASTGATHYDVRLGTSSTPPVVATNQAGTSYQPAAALSFATKYFWQITAHGPGGTTSGPVWSFTTETEPEPPPPPPPSTTLRRLRVLTWNVNGGKNRTGAANVDAQVSLIARSGAHVIVLQEVTIENGVDLPALFESKLEAATGRAWFALWAEEPRPVPAVPQGNLVLSMLPVGATETIELDAAPSDPANLDAKRSAARITVTVNGVPVTIVATALASAAASRQIQVDQLQAWMAPVSGPRLFGGSLGMRPGDPGYADLAGTFADVWPALVTTNDTGVTAEAFGSPPGPARVDGWWQELPGGSPAAAATEVWIVKTARSDHHALVAEVDVR